MNPLAITTALQGAGGFGKTTLAAAICHDDDIVTAFDDGILWATLGERANVQQELTRLYAALTGDRPAFVDAEDASIELAARLEDKNCLIVIDDVWDPDDVEAVSARRPALRASDDHAATPGGHRRRREPGARGRDDSGASRWRCSRHASTIRPPICRHCARLAERLGEWPLLLRLRGLAAARADGAWRHGRGRAGLRQPGPRQARCCRVRSGDASSRDDAVASTVAASLAILNAPGSPGATELAILADAKAGPALGGSGALGPDVFDTEICAASRRRGYRGVRSSRWDDADARCPAGASPCPAYRR